MRTVMLRQVLPCLLTLTACGPGTATLASPDCITHLEAMTTTLTVEAGQSLELSAKWANGCEGAMSDAAIQFVLTDAPLGTWLAQTQAVTGADGIARVTLQTGPAPGVALITAKAAGESVDLTVTVTSAGGSGGGATVVAGPAEEPAAARVAAEPAEAAADPVAGGRGGGSGGGATRRIRRARAVAAARAVRSGRGSGGGASGGGSGGGASGGGSRRRERWRNRRRRERWRNRRRRERWRTRNRRRRRDGWRRRERRRRRGHSDRRWSGRWHGRRRRRGHRVEPLPTSMACGATTTASVTLRNNGSTTWNLATHQLAYVGDLGHLFLPPGELPRIDLPAAIAPGASVTLPIELHAPILAGTWEARFRMSNGTTLFGTALVGNITVSCAPVTNCSFPQGVAEANFTGHTDTNATVANLVNTVMEQLSGCGRSSDCYIGDRYTDQTWFAAVTAELRARGLCAGQHEAGYTDEIAVSMTGCGGLWFGYHVFFYGGQKVVWNNGAQRGSWSITPSSCP